MKERTSRPLASPTRQQNFEKWKNLFFLTRHPAARAVMKSQQEKEDKTLLRFVLFLNSPPKGGRAAENIVLKIQGASLFQVLLEGGESLKGAGDIFLQEKSPAPFKVFLNS